MKPLKVIIDRFEGNFAVVELENKKTVDMPRELVPKEAKEGDILEIRINKGERKERGKRVGKLIDELWKKE